MNISGTLDAGSSTIEVKGNWESNDGYFLQDTSTVFLTGTGTLHPRTSYTYRFNDLHLAYPGQTTTMTSSFYVYDFYVNNGTLEMQNYDIGAYGYSTEGDSYIYGNATITSTGGRFGPRIGSDIGKWNNSIYIPHLWFPLINHGDPVQNRTITFYDTMNAQTIEIDGSASNQKEGIFQLNGQTINAENLTLNAYVLIIDNESGTIDVSNDISIANGSYIELSSGTIDADGDLTIEDGGAFYGGSGSNEFGSIYINSGADYTATSGTTEITSVYSGENWAYKNDGTFNHNNGKVKFTTSTYYPRMYTGGISNPFYDFEVALQSTPNPLAVADDDILIENNLNITSGDLFSKYHQYRTINVTGNTLIKNGARIGWSGVHYYFGNSYFNNLTIESGAIYNSPNGTAGYVTEVYELFNNSGTILNPEHSKYVFAGDSQIYSPGTSFNQIIVSGNATIQTDLSYSSINVTSTGNLTYSANIGDDETNYYKQAGGYVSIADNSILVSNDSRYNKNIIPDNTTGSNYWVDTIQSGSAWYVNTLACHFTQDETLQGNLVCENDLTIDAGVTLNTSNYNLTVLDDANITGTLVAGGPDSIFNVTNGVVVYDSGTLDLSESSANMTWGWFTTNGGDVTFTSETITINSEQESGDPHSSYSIYFDNTCSFDPNDGTIKITTPETTNMLFGGLTKKPPYNLEIDNGGYEARLQYINDITNDVTITSGTLRFNDNTHYGTIGGDVVVKSGGTFGHSGWAPTSAVNIGSLTIESGGTAYLGSGTTNIDNGFCIDGGTLNGGSGDVNAEWAYFVNTPTITLPSGTLTLTGEGDGSCAGVSAGYQMIANHGATFDHNSGTIELRDTDLSTATNIATRSINELNNLIVNYSTQWVGIAGNPDDLTLDGNLTIIEGKFDLNDGIINIFGDVIIQNNGEIDLAVADTSVGSFSIESGGTLTGNGQIVKITSENPSGFSFDADGTISGTIDLNLTYAGTAYLDITATSGTLNNIYVDDSSAVYYLASSTSHEIAGNLIINNGQFGPDADTYSLTIGGNLLINSGGTLDSRLSDWTGDLTIGGDMSGTGTYSHGDQIANFPGADSDISYDIMNVTSTGNLTYSANIGDDLTNYYKQAGGYVSIADSSVLVSNDSRFNGNIIPDNTTGANYWVDTIQSGSNWIVNNNNCHFTSDETLTGDLTCSDDLTIDPGVTLDSAGYSVTVTNEAWINGTFNASTNNHTLGAVIIPSSGEISAVESTLEINGENDVNYMFDHDGAISGIINLKITNPDSWAYADLDGTGNINNLEIDSSGHTTHLVGSSITLDGDCKITTGNLRSSQDTTPLTIGGDLLISSGTTFGHSLWTGKLTIGGNMRGTGTYSHGAQEVEFNKPTAAQQIMNNFTFYDLIANSALEQNYQAPNVVVEHILTINSGKSYMVSSSGQAGTLTLGTASSSGKIENNGTFKAHHPSAGSYSSTIQAASSSYYADLTGTGVYDWDIRPEAEIHWKWLNHKGTDASAKTTGGNGVTIVLDGHNHMYNDFTIASGDTMLTSGNYILYTHGNFVNNGEMTNFYRITPQSPATYTNINVTALVHQAGSSTLKLNGTSTIGSGGITWYTVSNGPIIPYDSSSIINVTGGITVPSGAYFGANSTGHLGNGSLASEWDADMSWGYVNNQGNLTASSGVTSISMGPISLNNSGTLNHNFGTFKFKDSVDRLILGNSALYNVIVEAGATARYSNTPFLIENNLIIESGATFRPSSAGDGPSQILNISNIYVDGSFLTPVTAIGEHYYGSINVSDSGIWLATSGNTHIYFQQLRNI